METDELYRIFMQCTGVTTDSRHCPAGSLFIALKGEHFNGNAFASKALEEGCAYAVIDEQEYLPRDDRRYILTDNCLLTLQRLARHHRRTLGTPVIGITGTNGKTTTKELVSAVLKQQYHLLYTQGNLNNHIGVPLTLLQLRPEHQLAVIEMGASHPGDIKELVEIAEPNYGLITNVGKAHLEGFGSFEGVMKTKGELYEFLRSATPGLVFLNNDDPYLKQMAHGLPVSTYGSTPDAHVNGDTAGDSPFLTFEWQLPDGPLHRVETRLIGSYNLPNALAAVAVGCHFHVEASQIDQALSGYTPQNNRSQWKKTTDNELIIDAYNANPTSMHAAIENFYRLTVTGQKMLIIGDMRELGADSAAEHQRVIDYLEECGFKEVILVGTQFAATRHRFVSYPDAVILIQALQQQKPTGKVILIKGSNGIRLGSIVDYL